MSLYSVISQLGPTFCSATLFSTTTPAGGYPPVGNCFCRADASPMMSRHLMFSTVWFLVGPCSRTSEHHIQKSYEILLKSYEIYEILTQFMASEHRPLLSSCETTSAGFTLLVGSRAVWLQEPLAPSRTITTKHWSLLGVACIMCAMTCCISTWINNLSKLLFHAGIRYCCRAFHLPGKSRKISRSPRCNSLSSFCSSSLSRESTS